MMMNELQQAFELRARTLGYNLRRNEDGNYVSDATFKIWKWYESGSQWLIEVADPNFNMAYEG